jgi:hypothetical protein
VVHHWNRFDYFYARFPFFALILVAVQNWVRVVLLAHDLHLPHLLPHYFLNLPHVGEHPEELFFVAPIDHPGG